jgi:hypothetical protein
VENAVAMISMMTLVTLQPHDGVYLVQGGTVVDLALLGDIFDR